jgi:3-oxoacyl-[acyl-carrier-protein] synthase-3
MIKVIGTGSYLPEKILTNDELSKMVDTNNDWIVQRTGILERRIARPDEATSDMAIIASKKALEMAGMKPLDVELIIVGTSTPDFQIPAVAPIIADKLGCEKAYAFDVNSVCTSFAAAFINAYSMVAMGFYNNCLIIGSDTYSKILNWEDRTTCILFGDGAGAMVIKKDQTKKGVLGHAYGVDGKDAHCVIIPVGGSRNPLHPDTFNKYKKEYLYFQMDGRAVYEFTLICIPEAIEQMIEKAGLTKNDIDWFVLHQANRRIIEAVAKRLGLSRDKFIINIDNVGNTSSGSIPIAMDDANRAGKFKSGDKILMIGFGGGLSWGGVVFEW